MYLLIKKFFVPAHKRHKGGHGVPLNWRLPDSPVPDFRSGNEVADDIGDISKWNGLHKSSKRLHTRQPCENRSNRNGTPVENLLNLNWGSRFCLKCPTETFTLERSGTSLSRECKKYTITSDIYTERISFTTLTIKNILSTLTKEKSNLWTRFFYLSTFLFNNKNFSDIYRYSTFVFDRLFASTPTEVFSCLSSFFDGGHDFSFSSTWSILYTSYAHVDPGTTSSSLPSLPTVYSRDLDD